MNPTQAQTTKTSNPITDRILTKLGSTKTLDELFEEVIYELRQEAQENPDPENLLHFAHIRYPFAPALCGTSAPDGGWFNQAAKKTASYFKLIQAPTCPTCQEKFIALMD